MSKSAAMKAEAQDAAVKFEHLGIEFQISKDQDLEAVEAFEDGNIVKAVKAMLGEAKYREFTAKVRKDSGGAARLSDLNDLMSVATEAMGNSMGES